MIVCLITSELSLEESSLILLLYSIQLIGSLCIGKYKLVYDRTLVFNLCSIFQRGEGVRVKCFLVDKKFTEKF